MGSITTFVIVTLCLSVLCVHRITIPCNCLCFFQFFYGQYSPFFLILSLFLLVLYGQYHHSLWFYLCFCQFCMGRTIILCNCFCVCQFYVWAGSQFFVIFFVSVNFVWVQSQFFVNVYTITTACNDQFFGIVFVKQTVVVLIFSLFITFSHLTSYHLLPYISQFVYKLTLWLYCNNLTSNNNYVSKLNWNTR